MIGLYIHIPFCARRCPYCDFAVHIGQALAPKYLHALHAELKQVLEAHFRAFPEDRIGTIFCGGGTPTSIGAPQLNTLLSIVRDHAPLDERAEITLEGNPEDASPAMFSELRASGWNRLSLGVQSLDDSVLQVLGRHHRAEDVERAVAQAQSAGWDNINLDLIYAVSGQSLESWRETLNRAVELEVAHLSCYSLTIESGTAFGLRVERGRMNEVPDDTQAAFMDEAHQVLEAGGLSRYEVSNYARVRRECRHNLGAWRGGNYLACGVGAHGHLDGHRWWNRRGVVDYIAGVESGQRHGAREGEEFLAARQRLDELVLMGLRLREGFDVQQVNERAGVDVETSIGKRLACALERGDVERGALEESCGGEHSLLALRTTGQEWLTQEEGPRVRLCPSRWALADAVALDVLR